MQEVGSSQEEAEEAMATHNSSETATFKELPSSRKSSDHKREASTSAKRKDNEVVITVTF